MSTMRAAWKAWTCSRVLGISAQKDKTNQYVEETLGFTLNGLNQKAVITVTGVHAEYPRYSSQATLEFINKASEHILKLTVSVPMIAMSFAEDRWTKGYCLELRVPDLEAGEKAVQPNEITPFTVNFWHTYEKTELPLPVTANLSSGQVSVSPAGSKVPAPAKFTYQAPEKEARKQAWL